MTKEELKDEIKSCCNIEYDDHNGDEEIINLIQQAKSEWCKMPNEKEIDKRRKFKMDIYSNDSAWNRYSEGFMDAINYIKEFLNAPEPE